MIPSTHAIVSYAITADDAKQIETVRAGVLAQKKAENPDYDRPPRASAVAGDVLPMVILRIVGSDPAWAVDGAVTFDANYSLDRPGVTQVDPESTDKQGHWFGPAL